MSRGSKTGLEVHLEWHLKRHELADREDIKAWLTAGLMTVLHMPANAFNSDLMRIMYGLARLGPVNNRIATARTEGEAA